MQNELERFIALLLKAGLVSKDQIKDICEVMAPTAESSEDTDSHPTDRVILDKLVDSGHLTEFQISSVRDGNIDDLLLDDYLITDEIGKGGMGCVYKAKHTVMDRDVAVKFTDEQKGVTGDKERFKREVQALSRLVHPNIVSALDAGYHRERCYLVMEYVQGSDLSTHVRKQGPMNFIQMLDVAISAALGLKYLHRQKVIHRDIKPGNILLTEDGDVKLLDVGLARFSSGDESSQESIEDEDLTKRGQILGTVDFMAPEQAIDSRSVTPAADIYGLGCTLFYLVCGRPPFARGGKSTLARLVAHRDSPIPLLSQHCLDVPTEFDSILEKMLAKNPENRYPNADELLADLRRIQRDYSSIIAGDLDGLAATNLMTDPIQTARRRAYAGWLFGLLVLAVAIGTLMVIRNEETRQDDLPRNRLALADSEGLPARQRRQRIETEQLPFDLISLIDEKEAAIGEKPWLMEGSKLISPDVQQSLLPIRAISGLPFQIRMKVRRISGDGPLVLYLPINQSATAMLILDDQRGVRHLTGIGFGPQERLVNHAFTSRQLQPDRDTEIRMVVESQRITCMNGDGEVLAEWSGDTSTLSVGAGWREIKPPCFVIATNKSGRFAIEQFVLEPVP